LQSQSSKPPLKRIPGHFVATVDEWGGKCLNDDFCDSCDGYDFSRELEKS
jgi:hypothetical protein